MSFASSRLSFQCWLRSRTPSQWASPESWAPPVQVVVLLLLSQARLWFLQLRQWPQHLQQRPRPVMRWRPLCCAPRLLGPPLPGRALVLALLRRCPNVLHGHRVAVPALLLVCVALSPSRSRDWSRAWPPRVAHRSRLPSCASHALLALSTLPRQSRSPPLSLLDPPFPPLRPPRPLVPRSLRPTPMTNGTRSLTHTASLVPRPPSPSRLTPLELVGVPATSVAAVSAKPPSAPCGGTFSSLLLSLCVLPVQRGHAGGLALGPCTLSRVMSSCWSLQSSPAASGFAGFARRRRRRPWCGIPLDFFADSEKFYVCRSASLACTCELGVLLGGHPFWRSIHTGAGLAALGIHSLAHGCGDCRWCHDEVHCAQHHRPRGVESRRPRRALSTSWESSFADVCSVARRSQRCDWPVFSTFA